MFNIGPGELIIILILALVLLGPKRLPDVARTVGKGMRELRRATEDLKDSVESEFYKLEHPDSPRAALRPPEGRTVPVEIVSAVPAPPETTSVSPSASGTETDPASAQVRPRSS
jgi:sec-independent protein translocase protein TatB